MKESGRLRYLREIGLIGSLNDSGVMSTNYKEALYQMTCPHCKLAKVSPHSMIVTCKCL